MNQSDKAERARRFDFVRLMRPVGEQDAGAEGVVCDDATVDEVWVVIELVDEEGGRAAFSMSTSVIWNSCSAMWPEAGAGSTKPGGAVLDADSYEAGPASDSKRRASTLSMRPYSTASAGVMK
jgi:hypothetical protein